MHPALWKLTRLQARSTLRRIRRSLGTPRGVIFSLVGIFILLLWFGPVVVSAAMAPAQNPEAARRYIPLALFAFCVLTLLGSNERAPVYFTPSEVDFLFAGPFTRRQLLVYKLARVCGGTAMVSFFLGFGSVTFASFWFAGFFGCYLALLFISFVGMAVTLVAQTVTERAYNLTRKLLLLAVLVVIAVACGQGMLAGAEDGGGMLARARESTTMRVLLAPFQVFARAITAQSLFPEFVAWGAAAAAMNLALVVFIIWLDADYLEVAMATSQKMYARIQRMRRGGGGIAWGLKRTARWRMPRLPRWGGAGSIAWRQLTTALRNSPAFLIVLMVIAVAVGVIVWKSGDAGAVAAIVPVLLMWSAVMFPMMLRFDFRGDLDYMECLKTLPLRPAAVALGELIAPVTFASIIHFTLVGSVIVVLDQHRVPLVIALAFVPLANLLLFGLENLFFLLFPTRVVTATPADFQFIGRQMVVMVVKFLLLGVLAGVAAAPGFLAYWLTGWWWPAFVMVAWVMVLVEAILLLPPIAWAYARFDVSADTPA